MNDFNPGEGWREVTEREWLATPIDSDHVDFYANGRQRRWVREEPVPALPTEPYTVIRATFPDDPIPRTLLLREDSTWFWIDRDRTVTNPNHITGFEVLAEPRAVTAKAVLDRVCEHIPTYGDKDRMWDIAREFGVSS